MLTTHRHLAKLGAFLTIFSLAVDPFIQQIVAYPVRMVISDVNSTIPIAHLYNDYAPGAIMAREYCQHLPEATTLTISQ